MRVGRSGRCDMCSGTLLAEPPAKRPAKTAEYPVVAGTGTCRACRREGKNPKTGGRPCGGYIGGYPTNTCKTCGHAWDQHE